MRNWTLQSQVAVKTYWLITTLFGCFYGLYGYYAFAYLEALSPGSSKIFEGLLFVLAATMLFEFLAEPITGRYADTFGRRQATTIAFGLVTIAFLIYASIAVPILHLTLTTVVVFAILAEFVLAFGLAFHSGSLDSWVVEQVYYAESSKEVKTEPIFGIAGILFALSLTLGGITGAFAVPNTGSEAALWPWFLSAFLSLLTIFIVAITMHDPRPIEVESTAPQATFLNIATEALQRTLQIRHASAPVLTAILVTSTNYIVGIVLIYFSLIAAKQLISGRIDLGWLSLVPIILVVPRIVGPWIAIQITARYSPREEQRYASLMAGCCIALGVSAILFGSAIWSDGERNSTEYYAFALAIGAALFTGIFHHMLKPITMAYLNYHIDDDSERAFLNSMATPFGAMIVALMCVFLLIWNHGTQIERGQELGWVFLFSGSAVLIAGAGLLIRRK